MRIVKHAYFSAMFGTTWIACSMLMGQRAFHASDAAAMTLAGVGAHFGASWVEKRRLARAAHLGIWYSHGKGRTMLYKSVMVLGVLSIAWSATWFARLFLGLEHVSSAEIVPMIVGGIGGGVAAWYFVPWLFRREAERRRAAR